MNHRGAFCFDQVFMTFIPFILNGMPCPLQNLDDRKEALMNGIKMRAPAAKLISAKLMSPRIVGWNHYVKCNLFTVEAFQ